MKINIVCYTFSTCYRVQVDLEINAFKKSTIISSNFGVNYKI